MAVRLAELLQEWPNHRGVGKDVVSRWGCLEQVDGDRNSLQKEEGRRRRRRRHHHHHHRHHQQQRPQQELSQQEGHLEEEHERVEGVGGVQEVVEVEVGVQP